MITEKVAIQVFQKHYRDNLFDFARVGLGYRDMTERTHGEVTQALQAETKRKLLCLPRGCFKSSICSVAYPIWLLIRNPNLRIFIASEVYKNSKNFIREIKHHMMQEKLCRLFGNFEGTNWNEGEITIAQRTAIKKEASVTCGSPETTKVGAHFDVMILDDMNSDNNSGTIDGREKVINYYKMSTSILEPDGTLVIVGTRYATNDLIGHIMENEINESKPEAIL